MIKVIYIILFLIPALIAAQDDCRGIDTVYSFLPGIGQNAGQGEEYYPQNIFDFPSEIATYQVPEQNPEEMLSLGFGGEIIVGFKDYIIEDLKGPDFMIFENAFQNPATKKLFVEPAKVAVSNDGFNFIEFQYDEQTLDGCAGITPTTGHGNPCDPESIGGDAFDLADVGLDHISHIKITDISQIVKSNPDHKYYDPIITGFDLDAVVGLHLRDRPNSSRIIGDKLFDIKKIAHNIYSVATYSTGLHIILYDINGSVITEKYIENKGIIDCSEFSTGVYFLRVSKGNEIFIKKILVY